MWQQAEGSEFCVRVAVFAPREKKGKEGAMKELGGLKVGNLFHLKARARQASLAIRANDSPTPRSQGAQPPVVSHPSSIRVLPPTPAIPTFTPTHSLTFTPTHIIMRGGPSPCVRA